MCSQIIKITANLGGYLHVYIDFTLGESKSNIITY